MKTREIAALPLFKNKTSKQIRTRANNLQLRKIGNSISKKVVDNSEELRLTSAQIENLEHKFGVTRGTRQSTLNDDYFEVIDSDEKAYWLGFLYADGYIYERMNKNGGMSQHLELDLASEDVVHIHKFRYCIGCNKKVRSKNVKYNNKVYPTNRIDIYSDIFCNHLRKKGVVPRKSLILTYPNEEILPPKYNSSFIRGYFDGDGCVYTNNPADIFVVSFVGTEAFLTTMMQVLKQEASMNTVNMTKKSKAYEMRYSGYNNFVKMYNYMYQKSTVSLDRKRQKFHNAINSKLEKTA